MIIYTKEGVLSLYDLKAMIEAFIPNFNKLLKTEEDAHAVLDAFDGVMAYCDKAIKQNNFTPPGQCEKFKKVGDSDKIMVLNLIKG